MTFAPLVVLGRRVVTPVRSPQSAADPINNDRHTDQNVAVANAKGRNSMSLSSCARLTHALLAGGAIAALSAGGAAAQTAKSAEVQEVVVTARRVTERLQDVPLSVAAIGQADIAQRQIQ